MKERPILFSGEMVRAILDGRKTQTRRVVKFKRPVISQQFEHNQWKQVTKTKHGGFIFWSRDDTDHQELTNQVYDKNDGLFCPYGAPGDRLWVRETWQEICDGYFVYRATPKPGQEDDVWAMGGWRQSIFMPRRASRITLEVVNVRVERVQDISEIDAKAEGIVGHTENLGSRRSNPVMVYPAFPEKAGGFMRARDAFEAIWNSINSKRGFGWIVNPWVWAIEFEVAK